MSNNYQINGSEKKKEIEIAKSPSIKNNFASPNSEFLNNKGLKNSNYMQENKYTTENIEMKFKSINSQRIPNKIQINYKKINSFNLTGNHTLKNEQIKLSVNSEQERYNRIKKKISQHNNNMNQRVQIFVPSEEYLDLLEEIDAENNSDNENDINNNSEEVKLDNQIMNNIIIETNDENKSYDFKIKNKDIEINMEKKSEDISSVSNSINENKNNLFSIKTFLKEKRELEYNNDFDINFDIYITEIYLK